VALPRLRSTVPGELRRHARPRAETAATAGAQVTAVKTGATTLSSAPDLAGLTPGLGCTVANWAPLLDAATCAASPAPAVGAVQATKLPVTTSGDDVFAVILGKANLSEFANSGSYSESGYGMVWNAFKPSKTSLGSSGGSDLQRGGADHVHPGDRGHRRAADGDLRRR
jgi:uncharacterized membrane protein YgcG